MGVLKQWTDFGSFHTLSSTELYKYILTIVSVMNKQWKIRPDMSVHGQMVIYYKYRLVLFYKAFLFMIFVNISYASLFWIWESSLCPYFKLSVHILYSTCVFIVCIAFDWIWFHVDLCTTCICYFHHCDESFICICSYLFSSHLDAKIKNQIILPVQLIKF